MIGKKYYYAQKHQVGKGEADPGLEAANKLNSVDSSQQRTVKYFTLSSLINNAAVAGDESPSDSVNRRKKQPSKRPTAALTRANTNATDVAETSLNNDTAENSLNSFGRYSSNVNADNTSIDEADLSTAAAKSNRSNYLNSYSKPSSFDRNFLIGEHSNRHPNFQKYLIERHVKHFSSRRANRQNSYDDKSASNQSDYEPAASFNRRNSDMSNDSKLSADSNSLEKIDRKKDKHTSRHKKLLQVSCS